MSLLLDEALSIQKFLAECILLFKEQGFFKKSLQKNA